MVAGSLKTTEKERGKVLSRKVELNIQQTTSHLKGEHWEERKKRRPNVRAGT